MTANLPSPAVANHPNCDEPCPVCDAIRLAFETWAVSAGVAPEDHCSDCNELLEYENPWLQIAWLGYQAGLAAEIKP